MDRTQRNLNARVYRLLSTLIAGSLAIPAFAQQPPDLVSGLRANGKLDQSMAQHWPHQPRPFLRKPSFAKDAVLVKFKSTESRSKRVALLNSLGVRQDPKVNSPYFTRVLLTTPRGTQASTVEEMVTRLSQSPVVVYAEPDYEIFPDQAVPNDARFSQQWGLHNTGQTSGVLDADIDWPQAWPLVNLVPSVIVANMDNGFQLNHPDLAANYYRNPGEISGNGIDDDANGFIDDIFGWDFSDNDNDVSPTGTDSHGTHTIGTIGAVTNNGIGVAGSAPRARLMPVKMYGGAANFISALAQGVDYAWRNGAKVISVSYNIDGYNQTLVDAIARADAADVIYVNSAGNNGQQNPPRQAIRNLVNNVVFVAATDDKDDLAAFSNYGSLIELAAPGVNVESTLPGSTYGSSSGTSMATPHVAGVLATLRAIYPSASDRQILDRLIETSEELGSLAGKVTGGRINMVSMLETDTIAPSVPGRIRLISRNSSTSEIQFTASGDDGMLGSASSYRVRSSDRPITVANWNTAKPLPAIPGNELVAGTVITAAISGLESGKRTHIALRAVDNLGNLSTIRQGLVQTLNSNKVDDVEGTPRFTAQSGTWAVVSSGAFQGTKAYSDSPSGNYPNSANHRLVQSDELTISGAVKLQFAAKIDLESGWDFLIVETSGDDGLSYREVASFTGTADWTNYAIPLVSNVPLKIRFRLTSDSSVTRDGVLIDAIQTIPLTEIFSDNMEGATNFTGLGGFAITSTQASSGIRSWTDSPTGDYPNGYSTSLRKNQVLAGKSDKLLLFRAYISTEEGFDFLTVRTSTGGGTPVVRASYSGAINSWQTYGVNLGSDANVTLSFGFDTDGSVVDDGVWIDDVSVFAEPMVPIEDEAPG